MKEFMMIFIGGENEAANLSPEEGGKRMQQWFAWIEDLQSKDLYVEGKPLIPTSKRVSGPDQVVTDGPFIDSKELVGGYFIVKAKDMDHAISMTDGFPNYDLGGQVEVREVMIIEE